MRIFKSTFQINVYYIKGRWGRKDFWGVLKFALSAVMTLLSLGIPVLCMTNNLCPVPYERRRTVLPQTHVWSLGMLVSSALLKLSEGKQEAEPVMSLTIALCIFWNITLCDKIHFRHEQLTSWETNKDISVSDTCLLLALYMYVAARPDKLASEMLWLQLEQEVTTAVCSCFFFPAVSSWGNGRSKAMYRLSENTLFLHLNYTLKVLACSKRLHWFLRVAAWIQISNYC